METKNTSKILHVLTTEKMMSNAKQTRELFASNRLFILRTLNLTELDYELHFLEAGCCFLEQVYDRKNDVDDRVFKRLVSDKKGMFWKWFKCEFKVLENELINVLIGGELELNLKVWKEVLDYIPHDIIVLKSFHHYLKSIKECRTIK